MRKPETLDRRVREMDESISRLYSMWATLEVEMALIRARLGACAPTIGLGGAGPTSAAPPSSIEDEQKEADKSI